MKTLFTKLCKRSDYPLTNIMKNFSIFPALLVAILFFIPVTLFAQGDVDAPIDGGLSILIAAGVGYGVKKALQNKKRQENTL